MKALKDKGLIKLNNFKKNPKLIYFDTQRSIRKSEIVNFMKIKMREYEELKKELNKSKPLKIFDHSIIEFCYTCKNYQPEVFLQLKFLLNSTIHQD